MTKHAKHLLSLVYPHLNNARRLVARAPDLASETEARLIVDRAGQVRAVSPAAQTLLAAMDGLTIRDGNLRGAWPSEDGRINTLIQSATRAMIDGVAGGAIAVARPSNKRAWILRASALPPATGPFASFAPAALLTIVDPHSNPPPSAAARWRALFGLTPAEARLTVALLGDADSLRSVSEQLSIAYATARVQLASVFAKVGVKSQAQLARVLTRIGE